MHARGLYANYTGLNHSQQSDLRSTLNIESFIIPYTVFLI